MEMPGGIELGTGSSAGDFEAGCDVIVFLLDLDLFWPSTHLGDEGAGLVADSGGNDSSRYIKRKKIDTAICRQDMVLSQAGRAFVQSLQMLLTIIIY